LSVFMLPLYDFVDDGHNCSSVLLFANIKNETDMRSNN